MIETFAGASMACRQCAILIDRADLNTAVHIPPNVSNASSPDLVYRIVQAVLLGLAWLALWRLSALMEYAPHASIWFPPAGLSFAALLVIGLRALPVLLVCCIVATFWSDSIYGFEQTWQQALVGGMLFGAAHCIAYGFGATVLRRLMKRNDTERLPIIIIAFLVLASVSALLAALLGVQALLAAGTVAATGVAELWAPWWIGDMAGAVVLAPLFAGLLVRSDPVLAGRLRARGILVPGTPAVAWMLKTGLVAVLLSAIMLVTAQFPDSELLAFAVFFMIIPQMWIAYTEDALRVASSLAIFSVVVALWVDLLGLMDQAMIYQFAITVVAASCYFGLAVPVLADHNRRLRRMLDADALTGVNSRVYFFERAQFELARARRRELPVSLILFDIDRFKRINDELGHTAGDQALVSVSKQIRESLRTEDLVGRFGGDEFMVLLTGSAISLALETAERLRNDLHTIPIGEGRDTLTASFSVVEVAGGESLSDAFERADANLLAAKRAGRDRVLGESPAADSPPPASSPATRRR